ncbi:tyrosine-type recombinase/integrase [Sphingobacterium sp. SRCM116780]|uniref:tyrosine-type recombinase/integrase n=1 Tax=Sphingobacterium sp. SRCM116780 TaxID=2907623 RepID=UPI001F271609|nr:tyrosine-type recombinase/integrase [Sphingobacterium sp. SRCM116780]UIR57454.1 tyrosine-type recombinase/integrase [Sphingobacterium sp. SRCM116780]
MSEIQIKVYNPQDLKKRAFIIIKHNNKWIKEYNGKKIGVEIKPNLASTIRKRTSLLNELLFEFKKVIEKGDYPPKQINQVLSTECALIEALKQKKLLNLNHNYIRNLKRVCDDFLQFLSKDEREGEINNIEQSKIQNFLLKFNSSGTYYMNKRRDLAVLFSQVDKQFGVAVPNIKNTSRLKSKPNLHKIYTEEQLKNVLQYLKVNHYNLYLCCLISYFSLLRPHQEVRKLTKGHFYNDLTEIHLSPKENKSGRPRIVFVPDNLRDEIFSLIKGIDVIDNIFSFTCTPYNEAYFSTAWTRCHSKMVKLGIVEKNHTIYSFRHTSAVSIYRKTKEIHLLQQIMGHSDMIVTLKYLRGLGVVDNESIKNYLFKI